MPQRKKRPLPKVGDVFVGKKKGEIYKMEVINVGENIGYKLRGKVYGSMSGAAKSLTNHEVNGWRFWKQG
jgi:hypothetical protein